MEQVINTGSQVVMAIVTLVGLWLTVRQQMNKLARDREERLTQMEANVENALRDQDDLTKQLHRENVGNINSMKDGFVTLKEALTERIHKVEIILARAGLNGHYPRDSDKG